MGNKKETFASDTSGRSAADFLTGPLVQFWLPRTKKPIQAILHEDF